MSTPLSDRERQALEQLGYTESWIDAGVLDRSLLLEQFERLEGGGSKKLGRYRAKAVSTWLARNDAIGDAELDAFLTLIAPDPDAKMVQGAVAELIQSPRLGLDQLGRIARANPTLMRRHEPLIRRTYLRRRLAEGVSDDLIEQVIELQDASVQTALVRDDRLSRKHAESLAKRGANPTIRKNAESWYQDKKAWK
jgi:hypothetical protein